MTTRGFEQAVPVFAVETLARCSSKPEMSAGQTVPQLHIAVAMAIGKTHGADVRRKIAAIPEYVWC
jgi:hypothetical protein